MHIIHALDDGKQLMAKVENLDPGVPSWQHGYVRVAYLRRDRFMRSDARPAFLSHCPSLPWRPPHKLSINVLSVQGLQPGEGGIFAKILYGGP